MAGFDNDIMFALNGDFTQADNQNVSESNGLVTNGKLWIGSTALNAGSTHINVGSLTSPSSTITIGYSTPNITIDVSGSAVGQTITGMTGGSLSPVAGNWNIFGAATAAGTNPVSTAGSGNTLTVNVQRSQAFATSSITRAGIASFNSSDFSVDSNGFVSIVTGGMPWTDVTTATQALSVQNGYLTDRSAGVTYTLPATANLGDEIKIDGKLGLTTIAQNANQAIRMSSALSTTGVTGTVVGTNVGDCITLRCSTSGASTIWIAENFVGNWTVT